MDIFIDICQYLSRDDLEKFQMVNKKWYILIDHHQKILPIRLLSMQVFKGFDHRSMAHFVLNTIYGNYSKQSLSFNEFYAQQEVLLNACSIHQLKINLNSYKEKDIKNLFNAIKKLSKTIYAYETTLMLYAEINLPRRTNFLIFFIIEI